MSQRLALTVIRNDNVLATAQWSWGAYTKSAAGILDEFLFQLGGHKIAKNDDLNTYRILRIFEDMGGTFMEDNRKVMNRLAALGKKHGRGHKFVDSRVRDGEFNYTLKDSGWYECFQGDANGRITVDVGKSTILFDVYDSHSEEDWKEYNRGKEYRHEIKPPCDIHDMTFDDFVAFREFVRDKWNAATDFVSEHGWRYTAIS